MSVALPDGEVATIRYLGDVPPAVTMRALPASAAEPAGFFGPPPAAIDPGFAMLERMQATMQRQTDAMLSQAAVLAATPGAAGRVVLLPASAAGGAGGCVMGTRITEDGDAAPQVVSFRSAGCGGASPSAMPGAAAVRAPATRALDAVPGAAVPRFDADTRLIEARADQADRIGVLR